MINRALDVAIVLLAASVLVILAMGGIEYGWGPLHLRLHGLMRPAILLALALLARRTVSFPFFATRGLLAVLVAMGVIYTQHHVKIAGGLDSYGYVSAGRLLASGRLREPEPLVALLPFEHASSAAAPLGYVPGPDGRTSVPRFPLGLPAVMAVFTAFGSQGPFYVPLIMAFGLLSLTYMLGREHGIAGSGLFAAALVGADPLVFVYSTQPMSDIPAACWLIAAVWLRLERPKQPILAGICAGMALLTRPALLIAAGVLGLVTAGKPPQRTLRFGATLLIFILVQMTLNASLYGSAATSGYGPVSYMFELSNSRLSANISNFARWLTYSHTALVWFLWPFALVILRRRTWAWQISAVAAAAAAPYLFYLVFNDWESPRFVLPAIVLVLILFARALSVTLGASAQAAPALLMVVGFACAICSHRFLERERAYEYGTGEDKYPLTGEWFETRTSDRAVVLAGLHSGSIRFYGRRRTIRWDQMPSGTLGRTILNLVEAGYEPYLALDAPSEPPLYAERFKSETVDIEQVARIRVVSIYRFVSVH